MSPMKGLLGSVLVLVAVHLCLGTQVHADMVTYRFGNITANNPVSAAIGEAQLSVEVSAVAGRPDQTLFKFINEGPEPCSITRVYFADGALLGIAELTSSDGVQYSLDANPPNLPGGQAIGFQVTQGFLASSDPAVEPNGVGPDEWLGVLFDLKDGMTFNDVTSALALGTSQGGVDGSLRIGIHVQGFEGGWSESFVNVPAPAAVLSGMIGLGLVGILQRRRFVNPLQ